MEIFEGYRALFRPLASPAVTIGNFDGVHLGHRQLLERACAAARQLEGDAVCLTFEPHPAQILSPDRAPPRLTPRERKLELIAEAGIDVTIVEPFDRALAGLEPDEFVRRILVEALGARRVVVGFDFRYGSDRRGDADTLIEAGRRHGFSVDVVEEVDVDGIPASSSAIRTALNAGDVRRAAAALGRPYDVDGQVVRGAGRGRELGIPTANIEIGDQLLPSPGIYATFAKVLGGDEHRELLAGATSLGTNPTFSSDGGLHLELHLLDVDADLYGETLRVSFIEYLRGEERFDDVEALMAQIRRDIAESRAILERERA